MHHRDTDKRLLILHQGALGDFITTFPALLGLRHHYSHIAAICRTQFGSLAAHLELIDEYFSIDAACFASFYTERICPQATELLNRFDAILLFTFSSDLEASISTVKAKNVYRIRPRPQPQANIGVADFLTQKVDRSGMIGTQEKNNSFTARVSEAQRRRFPELKYGRPDRIIISPGAGSPKKCWPLKNFLQLSDKFMAQGLTPEFLLGPVEMESRELNDLRNASDISVHSTHTLPDLVTLLGASDAFIGNDTAVAHLAAFLGMATVVIFGPTNPVQWRPYGPRVEIARPDIDCSPCTEALSDKCDHMRCLSEISVDRVMSAFDKLFAV